MTAVLKSPANAQAPLHATLQTLIDAEVLSLRAIRHDLHRHPELSFQEKRTSEVVQRELHAVGARVKSGVGGGTGVVGYLPASTPEGNQRKSVALRADMDALPISEATGKEYSSCTPGVMHACGHDGHTTMLIGAARVLSKVSRPQPVTFVFQPAEEGGGGADVLCKEGCLGGEIGGGVAGLGNPARAMFGLHGWPSFNVGNVATKPGPLLAATDEVTVVVRGTQAHGAYPHYSNDPIVASAHIITALQTVASRNVGPLDSIVITVGMINAGTASNIIPETVTMVATIRTLRPETRTLARERVHAIVSGTAAALGCTAEIDYVEGYPATINDNIATSRFFETARGALGESRVHSIEHATMGGEDFSYYGHYVPACFFLLGLKPADAQRFPTLHQADFDFNDDALPTGVRMLAEMALRVDD
jgi:amidohydrolase